MKIGSLYITRITSQKERNAKQEIIAFLKYHPAGREIVARMARAEVKNYLAELAEQAEIPFPSAAGFLQSIRLRYHGPGCPGHTIGKPTEECLQDDGRGDPGW